MDRPQKVYLKWKKALHLNESYKKNKGKFNTYLSLFFRSTKWDSAIVVTKLTPVSFVS